MSVKMRQEVERKIATAFIKSALDADYEISINNGGDEDETEPLFDQTSILNAMFQTDEEHLYLWKNSKIVGWVFFVYGNDGWDVISDYTTNLEPLMAEANKISEYYSD
jgi:hypothetical protein